MIADLVFLMFAATLLVGAVGVITAKNPAYAVLFLILSFFNGAGLFILLGAEFVGLLMIMVYVGAVAVMFLFVLMTIDIDFATLRAKFSALTPLAIAVCIILLVEIGLSASSGVFSAPEVTSSAPEQDNIVALGNVLFTSYVYPFITAAMILLVAMIGAIVLTHRRREGVRHQDITKQLGRTRREAVEVLKVESGAPAKHNIFIGKSVK